MKIGIRSRPAVRRFCIAAVVVGCLLGAAGRMASAATTWEAYTYLSSNEQAGVKGLQVLFEQVRKETGGELSINLHLGGSLPINATSITSAVADDVIQLGADGFFSGNVPLAGMLRLPMLLRNDAEFEKAAAIAAPYIERAYARKGIVVLGQYVYPLQTIWSRRKLTSLADIKGQKLRVTSVEMGEFVKRFGGIPLTMGTPDVPAALDRGVVDGVLTATSGAGLIWKDLLKYNYRFPVQYANAVIIVNKAAFDALPPATQDLLRRDTAQQDAWITSTMRSEEDALTAKLQSEGLVVTPADPADIQEADKRLASYWDEWAKARGPEAVEALGKIRAALGR
jgi:TRAP-type C4-dicarboxylate transport system substrate-binding protein